MKFAGKHVLITGGSAGIGFAFAFEVVKENAKVSLLARNLTKLEEAKRSLVQQTGCSPDDVFIYSADVTQVAKVNEAVAAAQSALGPVDVVVCNAGTAHPGYFHEQDLSVFEQQMQLNYFGVLYTVKALYDGMVARDSGHICLVSSALGVMGILGYSSYCPSKYAVKGLADVLRNELQGTGVTVSVALPPDTETPGYEMENLSKPEETKKMSESSESFSSEVVAKAMVKGIKKGLFLLPCPDFGLALHYRLVKGFLPRQFPGVLLDMLAGFAGPVIHHIFGGQFDGVARKFAGKRFANLRQS